MTNLFNMVVGDWGGDGHSQTSSFCIECTHTKDEVKAAYNRACEDFDIDPINSLCTDYEDATIPVYFAQKLVARGFKPGMHSAFSESFEDEDSSVFLSAHDWVRIILFMAGTQLMDFTYSIKDNDWDVGGYGLFGG